MTILGRPARSSTASTTPDSVGGSGEPGSYLGNPLSSRIARALLLFVCLCVVLPAARGESVQFTKLPYGFDAYGINNSGLIVGLLNDRTGYHAVIYQGGKLTPIPGLGDDSIATAVSNSGIILGTFYSGLSEHAPQFGFLDVNGTITVLPSPSIYPVTYAGVNSSGEVVGTISDPNFVYSAFIYRSGHYTFYKGADRNSGFAMSGINDQGVVVGALTDKAGSSSFEFKDGVFTRFNVTPDFFPAGINNSNEIVGTNYEGLFKGVTYKDGVAQFFQYPGSIENHFTGVNDAGEIVGTYFARGGGGSFIVRTGVPEPASTLLVLLGAAVLGGRRFRRSIRP